MSTKTISIMDEAYERLKARKKPNESFTDVINRITGKRSLVGFSGILSEKAAKMLEKSIRTSRTLSGRRAKLLSGEFH